MSLSTDELISAGSTLVDNIVTADTIDEFRRNQLEFDIRVGNFTDVTSEDMKMITPELWNAFKKWNNDCYNYIQESSDNKLTTFMSKEDTLLINDIKERESNLTDKELITKLITYDTPNSTEGFYQLANDKTAKKLFKEGYTGLLKEMLDSANTSLLCYFLNQLTDTDITFMVSDESTN